MKLSVQTKAFAMLLSVGLVAGCSSTGDTMEDGAYGSDVAAIDQDGGSTVYGGTDGDGVSSSRLSEGERQAASQQAEQEALRNITTFYFDFDTSEIKQEARDVLVAHAQFLANNPRQNVRLEGHADERGSREYNIGLGERRGNSVARHLGLQGASRGQLDVVSYGEERPASMGHDETSWQLNRRVEIIYTKEQ